MIYKMNCYTGCTSKQLIAEEFISDKNLQSQVRRYFNYKDYVSDVISDTILFILELKDDSKILSICSQDRFNYWLFSFLRRSKKGFNKHYNSDINLNFDNIDWYLSSKDDDAEKEIEFLKFMKYDAVIKIINELNWNDRLVGQMYFLEGKSLRKIQDELSINKRNINIKASRSSINKQVNKIKEIIKSKIND
jgi:hypothetical protein